MASTGHLAGLPGIAALIGPGIAKPDARAYQAAADALDTPIGDCLMVDDQPRNIDGALKAGMQAEWFDVTRPAASYATVLARLGLRGTAAVAQPS